MVRIVAGIALTVVAFACGSPPRYDVRVHVPGGTARASRIELFLLRSCDEVGVPGAVPLRPVARAEAGEPFGNVATGDYGLYGIAWEPGCVAYAAGCAPVRIADDGGGTLEVSLETLAEPRGCAAGLRCSAERCVPAEADGGVELDAGADGAVPGERYRDEVLADDPGAYWRFGERSGVTASDESGHGLDGLFPDGIALGEPGAIEGSDDTAVRFDGDAEIATMGDVFDFAGQAPFTIEVWVEPEAEDMDGVVIAKSEYRDGVGYLGWLLVIHVEGGIFTLYRGESLVTGPRPAAGEWTYVVVTFEDGRLVLYLNGIEAGTAESTEDVEDTPAPVQIGGGAAWNQLAATIDEVALYDHALPSERIRAHWAAARP